MARAALEVDETNARRQVSLKLTVIARLMRRQFDQSIATRGVTSSQWTLIVVVAKMPGGSQRDIADALEITEAAAGRLIERLCADGLLERRVDTSDKRARCVYLTSAAMPLLDTLAEVGLGLEGATFAGISSRDLSQLTRLLDKIHRNLTE